LKIEKKASVGTAFIKTRIKKSLLDQWLDNYWRTHFEYQEDKMFNVLDIDEKVH